MEPRKLIEIDRGKKGTCFELKRCKMILEPMKTQDEGDRPKSVKEAKQLKLLTRTACD